MRELSVFIDESGDIGSGSRYYLLALVFHDQSMDISTDISHFLISLNDAGLPDETFHFTPVLRGHDQFATRSINSRKSFLARFRVFTEKCPIRYKVLVYKKREFQDAYQLAHKMEKDLLAFFSENLCFFQEYDRVKVYYDNGQKIVRDSIHTAIEKTISRNAIVYKDAKPKTYLLFQMADYICGIELTATRYKNREDGPTEQSFFGGSTTFKKNWLKKLRKKQLE